MKVRTRLTAGAEMFTEKYCYLADPVLGITYCCDNINGRRVCYAAEPLAPVLV